MVPKLRFSEFSKGWQQKKIGDVFTIFSGFAFKSTDATTSGCRWLKIADVGCQIMTPSTPSFLPNHFSNEYHKFIIRKDDYVIALTRPILNGKLKIAIAGKEYDGSLLNQRVGKIVTKNNTKFVYSLLQMESTVSKINNCIAGTDPPNLSTQDIKDMIVFVPIIEEQIKIADFISSVDEKITLLNKQYDLLFQYKKGIMQEIFSQKMRFKDENGDVYSTWKIKPLKELYTLLNTNSLSRSELNYESGNIKNIHYGDIHTKFNGRFDITKELVPYISKTIKIAEECYCRKGDLVIADASEDYNDIGKCIEITNVNQQQVVAGLHTFLARPNTTMALGFGSYMMQSSEVRRQIKVFATGVSVLSITKKNLLELMIPLPSIEEQTKIANFLSALDDKIAVKKAELDKLKTWKQGLLQQMFI